MTDVIVRPFRPGDEPDVARICFETGYMGESAAGHFHDVDLFALLFVLGYATYAPQSCFVATADAQVVGYCVCTPDTQAFRLWLNRHHKRTIIRHALIRTLWRHPTDVVRLLRWQKPKGRRQPDPSLAAYPAHLHINVLPHCQRRGVGQQLISVALEHLKPNACGVHLQTSSQNSSALKFYEKLGFLRLAERETSLWSVAGVRSIYFGKSF